MRANRSQQFIIGGYVPTERSFDGILVGNLEGGRFDYVAFVRAGFDSDSRRALLSELSRIHAKRCPFRNLPDRGRGRWGEGMTAERMELCPWVKPQFSIAIEFLEWTPERRLRHPRLATHT